MSYEKAVSKYIKTILSNWMPVILPDEWESCWESLHGTPLYWGL